MDGVYQNQILPKKTTGAQKRKQISRRYQPRTVIISPDIYCPIKYDLDAVASESKSVFRSENTPRFCAEKENPSKAVIASLQPAVSGLTSNASDQAIKREFIPVRSSLDERVKTEPEEVPVSEKYHNTSTVSCAIPNDQPNYSNTFLRAMPKYRKPHKHAIESYRVKEELIAKAERISPLKLRVSIEKLSATYSTDTDQDSHLKKVPEKQKALAQQNVALNNLPEETQLDDQQNVVVKKLSEREKIVDHQETVQIKELPKKQKPKHEQINYMRKIQEQYMITNREYHSYNEDNVPQKQEKKFVERSISSELSTDAIIKIEPGEGSRYATRGHKRKVLHEVLCFSDSDDDEIPLRSPRKGRKRRNSTRQRGKYSMSTRKRKCAQKKSGASNVTLQPSPMKKEAKVCRMVRKVVKPSKVKTYCCVCQKPFSALASLKRHMLAKHNYAYYLDNIVAKYLYCHYQKVKYVCDMMSGVRLPMLFSCIKCKRTFRYYSSLRLHYLQVHFRLNQSSLFSKIIRYYKDSKSSQNWNNGFGISPSSIYLSKASHKQKYSKGFSAVEKVPKKRGRKPKPAHLKAVRKRDFRCPICLKYISSQKTLEIHLSRVHSLHEDEISSQILRSLKCEIKECEFIGVSLKSLADHARIDHPNVRHFCLFCNRGFYLEFLRDKHVLMKHKYREQLLKFACTLCGKRYLRRCHLKMHQYSKHSIPHNVKIFKCEEEGCNYTCIRRMSLIQHQSKHVKEKQFSCEYCGLRLKTAVTLRKHISKIHLNIRPYLCQICAQAFGEDSELQSHIKQRHTAHDEKDFFCQFCSYATSNKYSYQTHMYRVHKTRAPGDNREEFKCSHCDFVTIFGHRFRIHMNSHNDIRQYVCEFCCKAFVSSNSLRRHKLWLHSAESLSCPFCTYETKTKQSLNVHIRTQHTMKGIKPYLCRYCDFRSATGGNCRKHIMNKHKGLEVEYIKDAALLDVAKASLDSIAEEYAPIFGSMDNTDNSL